MNTLRMIILSAFAVSNIAHAGAQWGYEGSEGPDTWGKLSPDYALCASGRNQAPINIEGALKAINIKPLSAHYSEAGKEILNNGHTIQINFEPGDILTLDGIPFGLKQVHFHAPSENKIAGKSYPLEGHFVHADANGNLAVIAVMFANGRANAGLQNLWHQMPLKEGASVPLDTKVKPMALMPRNMSYYRYSGSLTTPPCSEGVRWIVLKHPITASKEQIDAFMKVMHHHNNRPIQATNGRVIVQ
jgi:carbonic anhydrase